MVTRGPDVNCGSFGSGQSSGATKVVLPAVKFHLLAWSVRGIFIVVLEVFIVLSNHHPQLHGRLVACQDLLGR